MVDVPKETTDLRMAAVLARRTRLRYLSLTQNSENPFGKCASLQ